MKSTKPLLLLALLLWSCSQSATSEEVPSFTSIASPVKGNASLPHLTVGNDEKLYLSWVEKLDSGWVEFKYASLENDQWSAPELIATGNDWFVNWADYPMLAVDKSGNKIAHYLAKSSAGTYSYDVNVLVKPNDATSWSNPLIPHTDGTPTEHGFASLLPYDDGSFLLAWLDGRNTGGGDHDMHGGGAMTIRTARMGLDGNLSEASELDGRVCDCCQTGATMTANGPIVVYRDRLDGEIRDMSYVFLTDSGWTTPTRVAEDNWNIEGCPVNGPRIASMGDQIAVAWFSAANGAPQVKVAFNFGNGFQLPIVIDQSAPIGRVDIEWIDETTAAVSWMDGGESPAIKYRTASTSGSLSTEETISSISGARGSGFPQMAVHKGSLYFAWTEMGDTNQIKLLKINR